MTGKASEIKTFLIEAENRALSDCINEWLGKNTTISIHSIQYQIGQYHHYCGDGSYQWIATHNALIIYKEESI
ncbi:hypothetical protein J2T13_000839 [Paenibacillus sp. DS2015]|uniref:hypothetical protein n=1 Tax=Paenibacillus sp. DS2015 TaxID=3373917 RepID=UPI003D20997E